MQAGENMKELQEALKKVIDLCHKCGGSTWLENKAGGTRFCKECGCEG